MLTPKMNQVRKKALWCNGSTLDFESSDSSSNLGGALAMMRLFFALDNTTFSKLFISFSGLKLFWRAPT
jgi:hypothetical protein